MGGRIGVESRAGHGLDLLVRDPAAEGARRHADPAGSDLHGGRLLLLSTDQRLRMRLTMLLPNWGLRVTTVENHPRSAGTPARRRAPRANPGPIRWCWPTCPASAAPRCRCTATWSAAASLGDARLVYLRGDEVTSLDLPLSAHDHCRATSRTSTCARRCPASRRRRGRTHDPHPEPAAAGAAARMPQRKTAGAAGRGQPGQPDGGAAPAAGARRGLRHRRQRRGRAARNGRRRLRPGADGLPDAGPGRLHRHPPLARDRAGTRPRAAPADRGDDRQRDGRRPPEVPRRRHGRLPRQAGHPHRAGAVRAPLEELQPGGAGYPAAGRADGRAFAAGARWRRAGRAARGPGAGSGPHRHRLPGRRAAPDRPAGAGGRRQRLRSRCGWPRTR